MDRKLIEDLLNKNLSEQAIAEIIGLSPSGVRYWIKKLGLKSSFVNGKKKWTFEQMIEAIKTSTTISDVLRKLNLKVRPGNYDTVKKFAQLNNISLEHMRSSIVGKQKEKLCIVEDIFIVNSSKDRKCIKSKIIKFKLIEEKCKICGMKGEWNNKPLVLILDHINGINNDNRLENLRFLCPNCNSQQDTFCSKNIKKEKNKCKICGKEISQRSKLCIKCNGEVSAFGKRKVERPTKENLEKLVIEKPFMEIGKMFGVTDNTVRKWCYSYGIDTKIHPRGYWLRGKNPKENWNSMEIKT